MPTTDLPLLSDTHDPCFVCPHCLYNMRGIDSSRNESLRCPECGTASTEGQLVLHQLAANAFPLSTARWWKLALSPWLTLAFVIILAVFGSSSRVVGLYLLHAMALAVILPRNAMRMPEDHPDLTKVDQICDVLIGGILVMMLNFPFPFILLFVIASIRWI